MLKRLTCLALLTAIPCCWELDGSSDESDGSAGASGISGCEAWRDALSEFRRTCDANAVGLSDQELETIHCHSDEDAEACSDAVDSEDCDEDSLDNCNVLDMADLDAATEECDRVVSALCGRAVECGQYANEEICTNDVSPAALDCGAAIGWRASVDQCVSALESVSCSAWQLPSVCDSVITPASRVH